MDTALRLVRCCGLAAITLGLLLLPSAPAEASILGYSTLEVDLTQPKAAAQKLRFEDTDLFGLSEKGLGRGPSKAGTRDVTVRTTAPLALGVWWRPTGYASVKATITWAGEHATEMHGDLYVSYSCDAAHWSAWRHVDESTAGKKKAVRIHETTLQVTRAKREAYWDALSRWSRTDVPWSSDEEAFVTWYRERHPQAFTKVKPFIGYVRFMYETEVPHGTYITALNVGVTWSVSGLSSIPKSKAVEAIQKKRQEEAWSWKADASHLEPKRAAERAADEKGVYEAALRHAMADAAKRSGIGTGKSFKHVVLEPYATGATDILTLPPLRRDAIWSYLRGVDRGLARDFQQGASRQALLPRPLEVGAKIVYVGRARWRALADRQGRHNWDGHANRWPQSLGRVWLSGIGFSADRRHGLVHVGRIYGYLAGYGTLLRLEKRNGHWTVVETTRTWVS